MEKENLEKQENTETKSFLDNFANAEWFLFLKDLIIIAIIVLVIRLFIAVPYQIIGHSMNDTYYDKEFIIVDRLSYRIGNPNRGDVIVFRPGVNKNKEFFLKRIIAIPGDTIKIEGGNVFIKKENASDFVELDEIYLNEENKGHTYVGYYGFSEEENVFEKTLGKDQYFVIGDNRNHSTDSRECFGNCNLRDHFVSESDMIGKVFVDLGYFSFSTFKFVNSKGEETKPKWFKSFSTYDYPELN